MKGVNVALLCGILQHVYNQVDIRKLLEMLASGNTYRKSPGKSIDASSEKEKQTEGLMNCASAFGIVGKL